MRKPTAPESTISTCSRPLALTFDDGGSCGDVTRLSVCMFRELLKSIRYKRIWPAWRRGVSCRCCENEEGATITRNAAIRNAGLMMPRGLTDAVMNIVAAKQICFAQLANSFIAEIIMF